MNTENLLVLEVQDLRKGDVVLVSNQTEIFEAKLRTHPKPLVPRGQGGRTHWWNGVRRYSTIMCDFRQEKVTYTPQGGGNSWSNMVPVIANGQEYNACKRIDFTGRKVIVIKREQP